MLSASFRSYPSILYSHWLCTLSHWCRYERVTDDREEDDDAAGGRTDSGCVAQYQSTTLRVLTHFIADTGEVKGVTEEEGQGQQNFLLGSDWQVEVTQLVKDSLRVEVPKVAQLLDGQVLIGLSPGITKLQVCVECVCFVCLISTLPFCFTFPQFLDWRSCLRLVFLDRGALSNQYWLTHLLCQHTFQSTKNLAQ